MGRNKYRTFPTTLGVDPNTGGPIARGKIIKPPEVEAPKPTFRQKGKEVKKTIKSRKQALDEIMGD